MYKSLIIRIAIVIIVSLIVIIGRWFFYYSSFYEAPIIEEPRYEQIVTPLEPSTDFVDSYEVSEGTVLIDLAHQNGFIMEELDVLILRIISRGLSIELFHAEEDLRKQLLGKENETSETEKDLSEEDGNINEDLEKKPLPIAFLVVCPREDFSRDEREAINQFVEKGGKLVLIADPTRTSKINSISYDFGLIFEPDYLYNMIENDANYRNIFISDFKENDITNNLGKITLYTAGSISSSNSGIAFGDDNTYSSLIETKQGLSPVAWTEKNQVLAIYDLTFLIEPYNGILDNNLFISNIADWIESRSVTK
jgi:hypothetical protein